ncbi:MAG: hypothetical protein FWG64_07310 [Firmicutes bacterium]|nr:hypothetical protein [Bacillota bacterium]
MKKLTKVSILAIAVAAVLLIQTAVLAFDRNNATIVAIEENGTTAFLSDEDAEYLQNGGDIETVMNSENTVILTDETAQSFMDDWRAGRNDEFAQQLSTMETFIVSPEVPAHIVDGLRQFIADRNIDVELVIGEVGGEFEFGTQDAPTTFAEEPTERDEFTLQYAQFGTETILVNPQNPNADNILAEFIAENTGETLENAQLQLEDWRERHERLFSEEVSTMETFTISPEVPASIVEGLRQFFADNNLDIEIIIGEPGGEFDFGQSYATEPSDNLAIRIIEQSGTWSDTIDQLIPQMSPQAVDKIVFIYLDRQLFPGITPPAAARQVQSRIETALRYMTADGRQTAENRLATFINPTSTEINPPAETGLLLTNLFSPQFGQHASFATIIDEQRIYSHEYTNGNNKILDELFANGAEYVDIWIMQSRELANAENTVFSSVSPNERAVPPNERSLFREYRPSNLGEQTACQPGAHIGEIRFNSEVDKIVLNDSTNPAIADIAVLQATRTGVCSVSGTIITETGSVPFFVD